MRQNTQMFLFSRATISLTTSYKNTHQKIQSISYKTTSNIYIKCIENYAKTQSLMLGKALHAHLLITGQTRSSIYTSKIIGMYVEFGELGIARKVFDKMPESNYRRWIVLIGVYAKCGLYKLALNLVGEMYLQGVKPNNFVLPSALKACGNLSRLRAGEAIHGLVLRSSFECDVYVSCSLIDMYSKCGCVEDARGVFDTMVEKDLVSVNAMVAGYVHVGKVNEALDLVKNAQKIGLRPDIVTWNTLIAGFSQAGDNLMVDELLQVMQINNIALDVVSWTSVISGLVKNCKNNEAFHTFQKMLDSGCFPNANTISILLGLRLWLCCCCCCCNTISILLSACADVANIARGREIHGFAMVVGYEQDTYVQSALVDMYAKCGCIFEASTVFQKMNRRNTPTWNSMIFGYANHGYCDEAIHLFKRMETEEGNKTDHLTFTAVLTACSHGGMMELGRNVFSSMQEKYSIKPRLEHYACMVDLLGRAGKLNEAYDFVKAMPIEPDLFVWGALLGACKEHGNIDLAEIAGQHLSELEPKGAGKSLLSNLYAGVGSWGHTASLKKLMKKKKLRSFPGCSWIEG